MKLGVMARHGGNWHGHILWWLSLALLFNIALAAGSFVNKVYDQWNPTNSPRECYSRVPSTFKEETLVGPLTSQLCYQRCSKKGSTYMALFAGEHCLCGDTTPDGEKSNSCDINCPGYNSEDCGGSSAYRVYHIADSVSSPSSAAQGAATGASTTDLAGGGGKNPMTTNGGPTDAITTTKAGGATAPTTAAPVAATPPAVGMSTAVEVSSVVVVVTNSAGGQATVTTYASSTASADSAAEAEPAQKKKGPATSTLVGAIVGSLVGLLFLIFMFIYFLRRMYARREQERMEKEYQEAIKPVDYDEAMYMTPALPETKELERSETTKLNPFDDTRRISTGSLIDSSPVAANHILTVVNPDQ
ncbi:AaceriADL020Wp [[Ashbya] aceris (nom. inval.)]|nr:AaceriADL020Wp [[Ashbya] aceris (nom. inval.)]